MNVLTLTARELGRLLRGRLTWLVLALTALSPAAGLTVLRFTASETMLSRCVADPALAARGAGRPALRPAHPVGQRPGTPKPGWSAHRRGACPPGRRLAGWPPCW